jgi:hypothetical protein
MSGRPARSVEAPSRVLLLDDDAAKTDTSDVFEVIAVIGDVVRARSPFLFEIGEHLRVRVEHDGMVFEAVARVRAHLGQDDARITELDLVDRSEPRSA